MININREDLAWAAGLFDGEGHTHGPLQRRTRKTGRTPPRIDICQIDRFVLDRFQSSVLGLGKIYGPYGPYQPRRSVWWRFVTNRFEHSQAVICLLWPWLSPLKKQQSKEALASFYAAPVGRPGPKQKRY